LTSTSSYFNLSVTIFAIIFPIVIFAPQQRLFLPSRPLCCACGDDQQQLKAVDQLHKTLPSQLLFNDDINNLNDNKLHLLHPAA
jgi:hypothetical protein